MMIDPTRFGVSFSIKQARSFGLDPVEALDWLIGQGWRRFRLMSYWDEHEKQPGVFDFSSLDRQIAQITAAGGIVTLCLGARQPRWPENHWPDWAWQASYDTRTVALLKYIETVVTRYKNENALISYQLENEALLKSFGLRPEVSRKRLRQEFNLVKRLDPDRPVIMTTSTSWGIPLRRPIPDTVGFSYYHTFYDDHDHRYHKAGGHYVRLHRFRALLIRLLWSDRTFIHELQCEPWGPTPLWDMLVAEQDKSMSPALITASFQKAKATKLYPIDIWGAEWWYWRLQHGDPAIWQAVAFEVSD